MNRVGLRDLAARQGGDYGAGEDEVFTLIDAHVREGGSILDFFDTRSLLLLTIPEDMAHQLEQKLEDS